MTGLSILVALVLAIIVWANWLDVRMKHEARQRAARFGAADRLSRRQTPVYAAVNDLEFFRPMGAVPKDAA